MFTRRVALRGATAVAAMTAVPVAAIARQDPDAYLEYLADYYWRIDAEQNAATDKRDRIDAEARDGDPEAFGCRDDGTCFPVVCLFESCGSLLPAQEEIAEYAAKIYSTPPSATKHYEMRLSRHLERYGERIATALQRRGWPEAHKRCCELSHELKAAEHRVFEAKAHGPRGLLAKYRVIYVPSELDELRATPVGGEAYLDQQGHGSILRDLEALAGRVGA